MSTGRQHAAEDVELAPVTAACDPVDDRNLTAATMQTTLSTSVESGWTVKVSAQPLNFKAAHRPANSWANAAWAAYIAVNWLSGKSVKSVPPHVRFQGLKYTKIYFRWGSAYSAPQTSSCI